jgi:beta-lactamase superfamily II metal-dependent hydrolase
MSATLDRDRVGTRLSPWQPGELDIHVISSGRGDATLIVAPDGRLILIDAGCAAKSDSSRMLPARPNASRTAGQWIATYIKRRMSETGASGLDTLLVTHLHDDHISGISDVADEVAIGTLIDPDYPHYGYPPFEGRIAVETYIRYVQARAVNGGRVERLRVGSDDQIGRPPINIRAVAGRGVVWTGEGSQARAVFPAREELTPADFPNENAACCAVLLRYGRFSAFFAGDLTDWADAGARPWIDALTPAARAVGSVDLALAPHHGLFDAAGPEMARLLAPAVWMISTWHVSHPSASTLERLLNRRLNPRLCGVYATGISDAAAIVASHLVPRLAICAGHLVARVTAGGESYRMIVTDHSDELDRVLHVSAMMEPGNPTRSVSSLVPSPIPGCPGHPC